MKGDCTKNNQEKEDMTYEQIIAAIKLTRKGELSNQQIANYFQVECSKLLKYIEEVEDNGEV